MIGKDYRTATKLVRGGLNRSAHQEISEALYFTSGFVYGSAKVAAAFRDEADVFLPFYRQTGAAISAFNAWVMVKALETLPLRVAAQNQNAAKIADWLFQHPKIRKISYPGHIRLSVGLEDCDDLIDDLDQALAKLPG